MATLSSAEFTKFDFAINGVGYMLASPATGTSPWSFDAPDTVISNRDLGEELSQNKLDELFWGSQRSWHDGAGQKRFDMPRFSSSYAFLDSRNVDIREPGELRLSNRALLRLTATNAFPASQIMAVTDERAYVAVGQPNLKCFGNVDASDAFTISTGTETSKDVFDMASDGQQIYIALGSDGLHRGPGGSQLISCDTATGWTAGTNTTLTANTTNVREGSASIRLQWTGRTLERLGLFAFSPTKNLSASTRIEYDFQAGGVSQAAPVTIEIRFHTTNGVDYYKYSQPVNQSVWQVIRVDTASFTAVGSPNWASITHFEILASRDTAVWGTNAGDSGRWVAVTENDLSDAQWTYDADFYIDDVSELGSGSGASHWSDWDSRSVGWAKDRVYAAGVKTGTQWRFFEADEGTGSSEILVLPDGWEVPPRGITQLSGFVYFLARRKARGVVYAYDGTNAPAVALEFDLGEVPTGIVSFAGAGFLIGTRLVSNSGTEGGEGRLYRAFPIASGALTAEKVADLGDDDGIDYGPRVGFSYQGHTYFAINKHTENQGEGDDYFGLGVYLPETGGYARHIQIQRDGGGIIAGAAVFKGRRIFTVDGVGLYVEQPDYPASGYVDSSIVDLNIISPKMWLAQEVGYELGGTGSKLTVSYSTDGGESFTGSTDTTSGDRRRVARNFAARQVVHRTELHASTDLATTPVLYEAGIGGFPTQLPGTTHTLVVQAYTGQVLRSGQRVSDRTYGQTVLSQLKALQGLTTAVEFQDPNWGVHGSTKTVRVVRVRPVGPWGKGSQDQTGGLIELQVKEVA